MAIKNNCKSMLITMMVSVILGIISAIAWQVPIWVAQFSGVIFIASPAGYILFLAIVAWLNQKTWFKSFISSILAMVITLAVYISSTLLLYGAFIGNERTLLPASGGFPTIPLSFDLLSLFVSFLQWSFLSAFICLLLATLVRVIANTNINLLKISIFTFLWVALLTIAYFWRIERAFAQIFMSSGLTLAGYVFEIIFTLVITTIIIAIGLKTCIKKNRKHNWQ